MTKAKSHRVAVLFHRLGPYHHARLRAAGLELDVHAIELSGADACYAWDAIEGAEGFDRVTLFQGADSSTRPADEVLRAVHAALDGCQPAAVAIHGWSDPAALAALQWCARTRTPAIMMSESTEWDGRRVPWQEWMKGRLVKLCAAGLVGGTPHGEYLTKLGMAEDRVFMGYDVVDNDYFATGAAKARSHAAQVRERLGLPEHYFLASARFVAKKNLARLIEAYARYRALSVAGQHLHRSRGSAAAQPWHLVLLGDGPLAAELQKLIVRLDLQKWVKLPGFAQYPELPDYYGLAGAFIHASTTEQWGLVVNEAMAASLPVLVSNRCGCAADLVREGINGFTFDPFDPEAMARLMHKCAAPDGRLTEMGQESRRMIRAWRPDRFGENLGRAVAKALEGPLPRANWIDRTLLRMLLVFRRG